MELREYRTAVRANWVLLAVVVALALGGGALVTQLRPPSYQATAVLFASWDPTVTADPAEARIESYLSLLRGREIARQVRDELALPLPPESVQSKLDSQRAPGTMLLTVTVTDGSAARANAMVAAAIRGLKRLAADLEPRRPAASTITVAQPPQTTREPGHLQRNLILALVLGLVAGFGAIALREATRTVLREPRDLDPLGAGLLGPVRGGPEDYRRIRTWLRPAPTSLLITSPGPREGAGGLIRGLASAFAEAGSRVVILDANLRSATDTRYPGLTAVLKGEKTLAQVLRVLPGGSIQLVPAGVPSADPGQALAAPGLAAVIMALTSRFDIVLVNAPAVNGSADAGLLGMYTDGVLLAVQAGKTRISAAGRAVTALRDAGATIHGTVFFEKARTSRPPKTVDLVPPPVSPARPGPADLDQVIVRQVPLG